MRVKAVRHAAAALAGAVAVVTIGSAAGLGTPLVTGDRSAWNEIVEAYRKLQALSGYRMRFTSGQSPPMLFEVAAPASVRAVIPAAQGSMETITVNGRSRYRFNAPGSPGVWRCEGGPSIDFPGNPAEQIQGTAEVSRGADAVVEGTAVRAYLFRYTTTVQGQTVNGTQTLYVGQATGLPRRSVTLTGSGEFTTDFYDYGARIDIQLPACPGG